MRILNQHVPMATALLVVYDTVATTASVYLASLARFGGNWKLIDASMSPLWSKAVAFGLITVLGLGAMGLYQTHYRRLSKDALVARIALALGLAALAQTAAFYAFPILEQGRGVWAISLLICLVLVPLGRALVAKFVSEDAFRRRIVIYGAGNMAASLLRLRRRSDQRGFKVIAFLPAPGDKYKIDDRRVLGQELKLTEFVTEQRIDEIVVAMDDKRSGFPIQELLDCKFRGINVVDIIEFLERESGRVDVERLHPSWLIFAEGLTQSDSRRIASRCLDLAGGLVLLVFAWPIMAIVALAILLEDGPPVFYRQTRVGFLEKPFELLKFRSMTKHAEDEGEARWAAKDDARITKTGRVIRKFRFDELPQVFNIVRGHMSLVGPRPERPGFVEDLARKIPYYHERHCVKPGLTGWAQLHYPYGASEHDALEKLRFDLYYVKNQSLLLDLMILLQTAEVVIWQKGSR